MTGDVISAGDVGRFAYCPLNWKRSLEGVEGVASEASSRRQKENARHVDALQLYQARARWSIQSSFLLALFAISAASLAVELLFLESGTPLRLGLVVLSVSWLMGSLYLFLFDMYYRGRGEELVRRYNLAPGEVAVKDARPTERLLRSSILPLRGQPDYVLDVDGAQVPVVVKNGRSPPQPFQSHVLQMAAYCYLVNEKTGTRPPHGVIVYPERRFEVPYSQSLEDELLRTLLRIQLSQRTGEAHRNHDNPRQCAGCSRREGCPERLDVPAPAVPKPVAA